MTKSVLLVEDDARTRRAIETVLAAEGYRVIPADSAETGWTLFLSERPDLVVLDLVLPGEDGLALCGRIRGHKELRRTPVIILTAKTDFETKVSGFGAGADQYLIKPVTPHEIFLWIQALLRRLQYDTEEGDVLRAGSCEVDLAGHIVRYKGAEIVDLTVKEFDLLYFLIKRSPQVLSRKYILSNLWHTIAVDNVVDVHLSNLRKKLPQGLRDKIQAVPGKGFRFLD